MTEAESLATTTVSITVQNARMPSGGTDILMPSTRQHDGSWVSVELPGELANSLTVTVLNFLVEEGLAYNRLEALPQSVMPLQPR